MARERERGRRRRRRRGARRKEQRSAPDAKRTPPRERHAEAARSRRVALDDSVIHRRSARANSAPGAAGRPKRERAHRIRSEPIAVGIAPKSRPNRPNRDRPSPNWEGLKSNFVAAAGRVHRRWESGMWLSCICENSPAISDSQPPRRALTLLHARPSAKTRCRSGADRAQRSAAQRGVRRKLCDSSAMHWTRGFRVSGQPTPCSQAAFSPDLDSGGSCARRRADGIMDHGSRIMDRTGRAQRRPSDRK